MAPIREPEVEHFYRRWPGAKPWSRAHVYLLLERDVDRDPRAVCQFFKVGSCRTPDHRIDQLRVGNPRTVSYLSVWEFESKEMARKVESRFLLTEHEDFERIHGRDWFYGNAYSAEHLIDCWHHSFAGVL